MKEKTMWIMKRFMPIMKVMVEVPDEYLGTVMESW